MTFGESNPLDKIAVGSPIYTRDYRKIGTVKELSPKAFKVSGTFLQGDYWLPARAVRTIAADRAVMLWIDWGELGEHKLTGPTDGRAEAARLYSAFARNARDVDFNRPI